MKIGRNPYVQDLQMNPNQKYDVNRKDPLSDNNKAEDPSDKDKTGYPSSPEECMTCRTRKYQDGSDENVSFKTASHISPAASGSTVRAHENEHVQNAYAKAAERNGQVVNASVSIHTAICPECGRSYVSGGVTNTLIRYTDESNPYTKNKKAQDEDRLAGANANYSV